MTQDDDTYGISPADFVAPAICAHCGHALHGDAGTNVVKKDDGGTGLLTSSGTPVAASSSPGGWGGTLEDFVRLWPGSAKELAFKARMSRMAVWRIVNTEHERLPLHHMARLHATIVREHPEDAMPTLHALCETWKRQKFGSRSIVQDSSVRFRDAA